MKFHIISLAIVILSTSILGQNRTKEEAIDYLVNFYPHAQLSDIYKSFYQDNYGPGHILGDTIAARKYFMEEIADTTEWGGPLYEFTGEGKKFVRLNMDLVRKGLIPADIYFNSFKNSMGLKDIPSNDHWIADWNLTDSIIKQKGYHFINEEFDRNLIKDKLENFKFTVHHSDRFNDIYKFHYRIISIPEFIILYENYLTEFINLKLDN